MREGIKSDKKSNELDMKPIVRFNISHSQNKLGHTTFQIYHPCIETTDHIVTLGNEYQYKEHTYVARVRLNNIYFENNILSLSLYLIDEDKCIAKYQVLDMINSDRWQLCDKDKYNIKAFQIQRNKLVGNSALRKNFKYELLEFAF